MATEISEIAYKVYLHGELPKKGIDTALRGINKSGKFVVRSFIAPIKFKKDFENCYSVMVFGRDSDYLQLKRIIDKHKLNVFASKLFVYFKAVGSLYNGLPGLVYDFFNTFQCGHQKVYIQPSARRNDFPMREKDQIDKECGLLDRAKESPVLEGFYHACRGTTTMEHFMALTHAFVDVLKEKNILPLDLERVTIKEEQVHKVERRHLPKKENIIERRLFDFDPSQKGKRWEEEAMIMEAFSTYLATYMTAVVRSDAYVWDTQLGGVVYIEVEREWRNVLKKIDKYAEYLGDKPYQLIFYIPNKFQGKHKKILEESQLESVEVRYYDYDPEASLVVKTLGKGYRNGWFMGCV